MKLGKNNMPTETQHFMFICSMVHKNTADTQTCKVGIPLVMLIFGS